jgi:hypothetical protein
VTTALLRHVSRLPKRLLCRPTASTAGFQLSITLTLGSDVRHRRWPKRVWYEPELTLVSLLHTLFIEVGSILNQGASCTA